MLSVDCDRSRHRYVRRQIFPSIRSSSKARRYLCRGQSLVHWKAVAVLWCWRKRTSILLNPMNETVSGMNPPNVLHAVLLSSLLLYRSSILSSFDPRWSCSSIHVSCKGFRQRIRCWFTSAASNLDSSRSVRVINHVPLQMSVVNTFLASTYCANLWR